MLDLKTIILEDDTTPTGGISFACETLTSNDNQIVTISFKQ